MKKLSVLSCVLLLTIGLMVPGCKKKEDVSGKEQKQDVKVSAKETTKSSAEFDAKKKSSRQIVTYETYDWDRNGCPRCGRHMRRAVRISDRIENDGKFTYECTCKRCGHKWRYRDWDLEYLSPFH